MSRPIPDDVIARAVAMRRAGMSMLAIGAAFGKSNGWASIVVRRRLPKERDFRVPADVRRAIQAMYRDGADTREIADRFARSTRSVYHIVKDLPRRTKPTPEQLERVAATYRAGGSIEAAARAGACSVYQARKRLYALGLIETMHRPPLPPLSARDVQAILERKRAGLRPIEIARALRLPLSRVATTYNGS